MRFIPVAPMLFRSVKGDEQVSFRKSKDDKTTYLIDYNMEAMEHLEGFRPQIALLRTKNTRRNNGRNSEMLAYNK